MKAIREMGKKLEVKRFFREEDGAGVVEVILILVEKYFISYSL